MNRNDYLMHYGVKGMKWGIRKDPRYESFRTRSLRSRIEDLDASGHSDSRKRSRLYSKYNKSKDRDYARKVYANKHPSHGRNIASYFGRSTMAGVGLASGAIGAMTVSSLIRAKRGDVSLASAQRDTALISTGMSVLATYGSWKILGQHIEQGRAINERQKNGRYDLNRR